jgi:hypothetical protein
MPVAPPMARDWFSSCALSCGMSWLGLSWSGWVSSCSATDFVTGLRARRSMPSRPPSRELACATWVHGVAFSRDLPVLAASRVT